MQSAEMTEGGVIVEGMSDTSARDAAVAELKLTSVGWLKQNGAPRYPSGTAPMSTHWGKGMYQLGLISSANATPRNAAVANLEKTTKGYNTTGNYWIAAMNELAKIVDAAPRIIYPANTLYPAEVSP